MFLSYNHQDKDVATPLAVQLRLVGADVWLDNWEIKPGDSIVGKVNEALGLVDTVLLLWSENAAHSRWVNSEMEAAIARRLSDDAVRIIPVRLDDTELPALLQHLKSLWADPPDRVVREITGLASDADYIKVVQNTLGAAGLHFRFFDGFGIAVGCPNCGAPSNELEPWSAIDYERDDRYAGVRCLRCRWEDGGEVGW